MNWTGMEAAEKIKGRAPKDLLRLHREFTRLFWWWGLFFFFGLFVFLVILHLICVLCVMKKNVQSICKSVSHNAWLMAESQSPLGFVLWPVPAVGKGKVEDGSFWGEDEGPGSM